MNELTQKYIELNAIAFERTEELQQIKTEIEKIKVLIEYKNELERRDDVQKEEENNESSIGDSNSD